MMAEVRSDRETEQKLGQDLFIIDDIDFDTTKDGVQSADEVANALIRSMGAKSWRNKKKANSLEEFAELFANSINKQVATIQKYQLAAYKRRVFEDILSKLDSLLKTYTFLFDSLPAITKDITNEVLDLETKHNEDNERVTRYVFARGHHKKAAYEIVKETSSTEDLSKQTKETFSESLYGFFADYVSRSYSANTTVMRSLDTRLQDNVRRLFARKILPEIKMDVSHKLTDYFDKGIINALRFEVLCDGLMKEYNNDLEAVAYDLGNAVSSVESFDLTQDQEKELKKILLEDVALKAGPYVTTNIPRPHTESYWGINPDIASYGVSDGYVRNLLNLKNDQVVQDHSFTVNQMICYRILYCAQAHNLNSYNRQSEAFRLYDSKIQDVLMDDRKKLYRTDKVDTAFSPHIDKRWHKESYLPDIDPAIERRNRFNDILATAGILSSGQADFEGYAGVLRWKTNAFGLKEQILIDGKLAPATLIGLFNSMPNNTLLKNKIVEEMEADFTEDRENETDIDKNILNHSIVEVLTSIPEVTETMVDHQHLTTIFDMFAELKRILGDEWYRNAYDMLSEYIMDYCENCSTGIIGQTEKLFGDVMGAIIAKTKPETIQYLDLQ